MPPCRRHFTPEHRLWLLERVRIRRVAWLHLDALDPEEDLEEKKKEELKDDDDEDEEEEPVQDVGDVGDVDLRAKQQTILDSIHSESDVEARCRRRQEMEVEQAAEEAKMFANLDELKEDDEE
ncbi:hypothetical protein ZWY2020_010543 [Hordeum vulgare]|nr:hypothetical protein ZWY2020_010543 [Hordeum vulgare]